MPSPAFRWQTVYKLLRGNGCVLGHAAGNMKPGTVNAREELIMFATMLEKVGFPPRAPRLPPAAAFPASRSAARLPTLTAY